MKNQGWTEAKLKETKINFNHDIFEIPEQNENTRRQTLMLALGVYVKNVWNAWKLYREEQFVPFGNWRNNVWPNEHKFCMLSSITCIAYVMSSQVHMHYLSHLSSPKKALYSIQHM